LTGESGTGKELVARTIHAKGAKAGPFVIVEADAPASELDSKLYGAKVIGTTIFLHEVGNLAGRLQAHLRVALEGRERAPSYQKKAPFADARLIAGTTRDLLGATREGTFDSGLYQQLSAFTIALPPLRAHREDIPLLAEYFLSVLRSDLGHQVERFSPAAIDLLMRREWLGNVRELLEYVRMTVVLSPAKIVQPADLWLPGTADDPSGEPWRLGYRELRKRVLLRFEADFVARVLKAAGGNLSMAARLAKIDRKHFWRLIQRTGIRLDRFGR
jgi:two-component system response regulator GlrR